MTKNVLTRTIIGLIFLLLAGITAVMLGSQTNPNVWRKHIEPTQALFSWVMNNHWGNCYVAG
ncbi:MAG: hypothetical protein M1445_06450 [Bacteroidetes bacterium]|nr:hypothetical protein [Bacteroidota bacterium]